MLCPQCGSPRSQVKDSRPTDDGRQIRRRRQCLDCDARFTTIEIQRETPLIVLKKDKSSEPFDRDKLLRGLMRATVKRDVPVAVLQELISDVENELRAMPRSEVRSQVVGEMVLERLRLIDDVAYIRFASVYRDFRDIDEFQSALKRM